MDKECQQCPKLKAELKNLYKVKAKEVAAAGELTAMLLKRMHKVMYEYSIPESALEIYPEKTNSD